MSDWSCEDNSLNVEKAAQEADRRRYPRHKCKLPMAIRSNGNRFPVRGETTDVSLSGCYVTTILPSPVGTEIEFCCWVGETPIACKAVIRTCDPGVGNGIEFLNLEGTALAVLGDHLDSLDDSDRDKPMGVIH